MRTRAAAGSFLVVSALVAWLTINVSLAARALQLAIVLSMAYVAWLAWRGGRVMRRTLREARRADPEPGQPAGDMPFVSIVLPARNEASVVGAAVASLRALAYRSPDGAPAYEVVVVDDGSSDATGDVARQAAADAAHVRVVRREPGSGRATKGAVLAFASPYLRGEVICVVDADTVVEPSFLERAMRAWHRDLTADALQVARRPRNASVSWLTRA
ncbi:MAG TPA: glycosyltransferase family 2 protein, partial [Methylomirabilota bacterium]|nr:glycosyltransferase family 2 protein [Methylomirabilota bacterium]